jgi:dihydrofolate synthase/folylpolyglutamate synthase
MLKTKDARGFLQPLAQVADQLWAVDVPGEANTLPASETAEMARSVGLRARDCDGVASAVENVLRDSSQARILICGSLYLAGAFLRDQGITPT